MNEHEEYCFSSFVFKFSKNLNSGDTYSSRILGVKPFIFRFLSPVLYNPRTFAPMQKVIFERGGQLINKMISPEHAPDVTIPSTSLAWGGESEMEECVHNILSKIQKPNYARTLLLEKRCQ
jgi:hypothetical protein